MRLLRTPLLRQERTEIARERVIASILHCENRTAPIAFVRTKPDCAIALKQNTSALVAGRDVRRRDVRRRDVRRRRLLTLAAPCSASMTPLRQRISLRKMNRLTTATAENLPLCDCE